MLTLGLVPANSHTPPILIVEFEKAIGDWCRHMLAGLGHRTATVYDTAEVAQALQQHRPWLLICACPAGPVEFLGLQQALRRSVPGQTAVLVLGRSPEHETEMLLSGADEYLTFPVRTELLRARIAALGRRSMPYSTLEPRPLRLDPSSRRAWVHDVEFELPPVLFSLLAEFMAHPDCVLSAERLAATVCGPGRASRDTIKAHVYKLRQALAPHGLSAAIHTVHHFGYRYDCHARPQETLTTSSLPRRYLPTTPR